MAKSAQGLWEVLRRLRRRPPVRASSDYRSFIPTQLPLRVFHKQRIVDSPAVEGAAEGVQKGDEEPLLKRLIEHDVVSPARLAFEVIPYLWRLPVGTTFIAGVARRGLAILLGLLVSMFVFGQTLGHIFGEDAHKPEATKPSPPKNEESPNLNESAPAPKVVKPQDARWNTSLPRAGLWNPEDVVTATFDTAKGPLSILALKVAPNSPEETAKKFSISISGKTVSMRPSNGHWTIGRQDIRIDVVSSGVPLFGQTHFSVGQDIVLSSNAIGPFANLTDAKYFSHGVGLDHASGNLYIDAGSDRAADPAYLKLIPFVDRLRPYTLGLEFSMAMRQNCCQISLPGTISVQLGEDGKNEATVKVGNRYVGCDCKSLTDRRSEALVVPLTRVDLSREGWLFVSFDGSRLILSSGINGSDRIRAIPIPEKALQRTWTGSALRSYGPEVLISKMHFGPYELDSATP